MKKRKKRQHLWRFFCPCKGRFLTTLLLRRGSQLHKGQCIFLFFFCFVGWYFYVKQNNLKKKKRHLQRQKDSQLRRMLPTGNIKYHTFSFAKYACPCTLSERSMCCEGKLYFQRNNVCEQD